MAQHSLLKAYFVHSIAGFNGILLGGESQDGDAMRNKYGGLSRKPKYGTSKILLLLLALVPEVNCNKRTDFNSGIDSIPVNAGPTCAAVEVARSSHELYGVWALEEDNILVAGGTGIYRLRDKQIFEPVWTRSGARFNSFKNNGRNGFAVGIDTKSGKMLVVRCDKVACDEVPVGAYGALSAVWVGPNDELVVAGIERREPDQGTTIAKWFHPNEREWKSMALPGAISLRRFMGTSLSNLWAVGSDFSRNQIIGVTAHFDGNSWQRETEQEGLKMIAIAAGNDAVFCGGGYAVPANNGRHGVLKQRNTGGWAELELDKSLIIWSLFVVKSRLLAGVTSLSTGSEETVHKILDLSNPARQVEVCTGSDPIEDFALLSPDRVVAVGRDGGIYIFAIGG